eukprot:SAG11_NODE_2089_length_3844_cov_3.009880_4_plen_77_part_00
MEPPPTLRSPEPARERSAFWIMSSNAALSTGNTYTHGRTQQRERYHVVQLAVVLTLREESAPSLEGRRAHAVGVLI